ncbi:hypothetical protein [Streptomyces formicae]
MLATGTATPSPAADVYALGASLLISATGIRAMEYPDHAEREEQRQAVVDNKRRPFDLPGSFGVMVDRMLSYEPYDRPALSEVVAEFRAATKGEPKGKAPTGADPAASPPGAPVGVDPRGGGGGRG